MIAMPAISLMEARCSPDRDGRHKAGMTDSRCVEYALAAISPVEPRAPLLEAPLDPAQQLGEDEACGGDEADADHHAVGLEARAGLRDQVAEPVRGAVHLAHDVADQCVAYAEAEPGQQQRH